MKRLTLLLAVGMITTASYAQSAVELAKQQRELDKINMEMLSAKPSKEVMKEVKKEVKNREKAGWCVPAGGDGMAAQLIRSRLMNQELMRDEDGQTVRRYISHTATVLSGSESAGYASARNQCQVEIAAILKTKVAAAMKAALDNRQTSADNATSNDQFNQRVQSITDVTLSMMTPVIHFYRVKGNNYEVEVRVAYDKKEMKASLKRRLEKELKIEGDELSDVVKDVLSGDFE
ncbi:MAG: hypothetical protein LUD00_13940 [Prevotellaceae bacterium]|nr:hypothetical protein [Prevotellaceae bacterium]